MPDSTGKLSDDEKAAVVQWLQNKTKFHQCPSCGANNWSIGDHLVNITPYTGGSLIVGGMTYPVALIVCNVCAYVRQYMAVPMGLLPAETTKND